MNSDLNTLIQHLQDEFDFLKSKLDQCIADWDFEGAQAFKEPLYYTKRKLDILRTLENPNFQKISSLAQKISIMEERLAQGFAKNEYPDEKLSKRFEERRKLIAQESIKKFKLELNELQSVKQKASIDDDKILSLLKKLKEKEISKIDFEIKQGKVFFTLKAEADDLVFTLHSNFGTKLENYFYPNARSILRSLGFELDNYTKKISAFRQIESLSLLTELSIIFYEVFSLYKEKEIDVKVK